MKLVLFLFLCSFWLVVFDEETWAALCLGASFITFFLWDFRPVISVKIKRRA